MCLFAAFFLLAVCLPSHFAERIHRKNHHRNERIFLCFCFKNREYVACAAQKDGEEKNCTRARCNEFKARILFDRRSFRYLFRSQHSTPS